MERHFIQELEALKSSIIRMGSLAEQAIAGAVNALLERRPDLARRVIEQDEQINALEIGVDNQVIDLLALHQPVAKDLRFIVAVSKMTADLERIGDHAVNIAESAIQYAAYDPVTPLVAIPHMAQITQQMLRDVIDGFIHNDPVPCRAVLPSDDRIDDLNRKVVGDLVQIMHERPETIEPALELLRVSRNLERVADLATNIAEDVIFVAEARVVKHNVAEGSAEGALH